jgi:outer membrane protein insertion porin family
MYRRLPEKVIWILLVALIAAGVFSSSAVSQSFNVVDVEVAGAETASTSLILSVAGIKKGEQLTATITQEVVKRLYGLGFFGDIQILAEEVTGGLKLTIKVKELPKLEELKFTGNKKIKSKELAEKIKITKGAFISHNLAYQKKNEILDLYADKGYFLVEIDYDLNYNNDSTLVDLTYNISEGSKVKVKEVILTGNVRVKASDIIGKMRNRKRGFLKSSNFDKDKYPEDKKKVVEFLHKKGHIDAFIKSDSLSIDTAANSMKVYIDIYEGPCYYFGETEFSGNEILSDDILSKVLKYQKGRVFDIEKFDESIYEVYFIYQEQGYLHVRIIDEQKTKDTLIDVSFDIVEGLPSEVNLVKITGNTKTKERVIRREMAIRPGQVFHRSLLIRSVRNIMQLNYFANVTPDMADLPSGDVDVLIEVEEKPTGQISAGAGYSGQDGFVGTFGLGIPNFRGMGQNLSFSIDAGSRRNSYSVSFTEPWFNGTPTLVGTDLYYTNRRWYEDYTEGRRGGSLRVGRRLTWPDDYFRIYVRYRLEDDRFYDFSEAYKLSNSELYKKHASFDSTYSTDGVVIDSIRTIEYSVFDHGAPLPGTLLQFGGDWKTSSSLQFTVTRDSRDLPEFATRGSIISYTVAFTGDWLGGYWRYQKHELELAKFIPILGKIALAGKLSMGGIRSSNDDRILEFDRYSPGGTGYDGIVRGYDDGTLTPDTVAVSTVTDEYYRSDVWNVRPDLDGSPDSSIVSNPSYTARIRGKYQIIGNLELQIPLLENQLYALAFFDAGRAWLRRSDIKLNQVYRGAGLGFRLVVPGIGTIGFDFGYPLDDRPGQDKGWKPHFQIGTTFR